MLAWERSPEWAALAKTTQDGYTTYIRHLGGMAHVKLKAVSRRELTEIRNAIAKAIGPGAATGFVRAASAMFGWAVENGWLDISPTYRMKRLKGGHLPAWSQAEADLAIANLPEPLRRAVVLALHTGQRRSDLIRMSWADYSGTHIRLRQQKTRTPLTIAVTPALQAELDTWKAPGITSPLILTNGKGAPWRGSNLSKQLQDALSRIPGFPTGRNIHGLRKLAAANLAEAGCTISEIASVTGHRSLSMVQLYTASAEQERLADAAVIRLNARQKTKRLPLASNE
jgi:integrase